MDSAFEIPRRQDIFLTFRRLLKELKCSLFTTNKKVHRRHFFQFKKFLRLNYFPRTVW